jgi:type II secretion system protein H
MEKWEATMTLRTGNRTSDGRSGSQAFTLIELILVMAILTIAAAIITPSLSSFFRGRAQESEAARLLSLTRYGQSRAVGEGMPAMLWVNPRNGTYGLKLETGYADSDPKSVDFTIDKDLKIDVANARQASTTSKLPAIHFLPDGTISATSVPGIAIQERDRAPLWVAQSANGLNYEIQDQTSFNRRIRR